MPAYAVGFMKVRDPSWQAEYRDRLPAVLARYQGRVLASGGGHRPLEGEPPAPDLAIIIEFPGMDEARNWYADAENAELVRLRQTGSALDLILIPGKEAR